MNEDGEEGWKGLEEMKGEVKEGEGEEEEEGVGGEVQEEEEEEEGKVEKSLNIE